MNLEDQEAGLDVWGFIKRRKSFVIVFALLGTFLGYMLFHRQIPNYRSSALVQVIHRHSDSKLDGMLSDRDLMDAAYVISSPSILIPAYSKHQLSQLSLLSGLSEEQAADRIAGMLKVKIGTANTSVVDIAVEGSRADEIEKIANAVAMEYVSKQMENYKDARGELESLLTRAREELHAELRQKEQEYNEFRDKSGLMSDGKNPHRERQQSLLAQLSTLSLRETTLKAELATLEEAMRTGGSREALLLMIGKMNQNNAAGDATSKNAEKAFANGKTMLDSLFPLLVEQADLEEKLGKDHPKVEAIKRRIQFVRKHAESLDGMTPKETDAPQQDFISVYLQSLRQELLSIEKEASELKVQADESERLARALGSDENEDRSRLSEIDRLKKLFEDVLAQMRETKVMADLGGVKAQILTPARYGYLVFPKLSQFLGLGAFLGAFVGLALGYLVEIADRSFRKPEDIIREFGVPIIGHVPYISEQRMKSIPRGIVMDRTAVSIHLPRSRPAEAYRAVRTAICFSALGVSHRVISVTSPAAGDGKSTLALNLALSLAQSGKRTVLVESDFRRPKVHKLTGVENKIGFVDVLRGDTELTDAIQETKVPDFFVLPCGKRPSDPAELLARPQFEQILQVLREKFDYVIIDTPPVLAVTDPCGVAARVDGVLVCMRLSRHTRDLGRRTIEQLRDIGATLSGIVINGVEERDAYGYGNYRYSDYRYYYKNYNYKYGEYGSKDGREYYADDHAGDLTGSASENLKDSSVS
jgi:succinoglycan biosynthesis transport protein ExoP